jgi:hypothetical protein
MSAQTLAALREAARDFMIVSSFAFWAVMIGFVPVLAMRTLMA